MSGHKHRKRFGQHFLVDANVLFALTDIINPQAHDFFLEIGPGEGVLTKYILAAGATVTAVEIDRDLVACLEKKSWPNFSVIEADVLAFDFARLQDRQPVRCIGNLPYNISTPLLFHCFDHLNLFQDMHFMLQQEVVLRLAAEVGDKHYSRLSVMAQSVANVSALFTVGKEAFNPPPKVESQIVRLQPKPESERCFDFNALSEVVRIAFAHRRKTLNNNFKGIMTKENWDSLKIDASLRPQEITVAQYIAIAQREFK